MKLKVWLTVWLLMAFQATFAQKTTEVDSLKELLQTPLADTQRVNIYNRLADKCTFKQVDTLTYYTSRAIKLATTIKYPKGLITAHNLRADIAKRTSKHDTAKKIYRHMWEVSTQYNYTEGKIKAYVGLGQVERLQANFSKSSDFYNKALELAKQAKLEGAIANIYNELAIIEVRSGDYKEALQYFEKSMQIRKKNKDHTKVAIIHNNMAIIYRMQGNYPKSLQYYFKALRWILQQNDQTRAASIYTNIGVIYTQQDEYKKALEYQLKALEIRKKLGQTRVVATNYVNMGVVYINQKKHDKALEYYFKALKIKEKTGEKRYLINLYNNIGEVHLLKKDYNQALSYLQKSLDIAQAVNDRSSIALVLINLGKTHYELKQYTKAIDLLDQGMTLAKKVGNPNRLRQGAQVQAKVYEAIGQYKKAYEAHVLFKQMTDSLLNKENTQKIMQAKLTYEFNKEKDSLRFQQKKEKGELNLRLTQEKLTNKMQRNINWLISLVLLAVLGLAIFIFNSRQKQKKLNVELTQKSEELEETNEELLQSREEVMVQKDAIAQQHQTLEIQNLKIAQSLNAAQAIQDAILPLEARLQAAFQDHFVIYRPKDVVSGDFYWFNQIDQLQVLGAIDCTGHGIPGAFMSMIGNTLLNKIISTHQITQPALILEELRKEVNYTLRQEDTGRRTGMDAAFVSLERIDKTSVRVTFAGAKRPLWYIEPNGSKVEEIMGSKISVGVLYRKPRVVESHVLDLPQGTVLYLGSDGFADQNDVTRKRFGTERLKSLLYSIHTQTMPQQAIALTTALDEYMKNTEQRDDILLIGLKL
jgi:serine phosphatase RsbU (regulator of sigma subunit)/tetratricopeptide (TPR) repeat protein